MYKKIIHLNRVTNVSLGQKSCSHNLHMFLSNVSMCKKIIILNNPYMQTLIHKYFVILENCRNFMYTRLMVQRGINSTDREVE